MERRSLVRVALLAVVAISALVLATSWLEASPGVVSVAATQADLAPEDRDPLAPSREGMTVVTTDPPGEGNGTGAIVAIAPDGRLAYYNDTYGNYFDVDPDPAGSDTVLYVAGSRFDPCPPRLDPDASECALVAVERVNLTTGAVSRVHTAVTDWDIWHDVDRVGASRLVVAGIAEDRVFAVNTTTGTVVWEWRAESDLRPSSGGLAGDWTHVNDVEPLGDGRVMASLRNQDRVVFLDPSTPRGWGIAENWTLGTEDDYDVLYEQHNPDYIPGERGGPAVLVADSENNRVVEYQRSSGAWMRTWTWRDDRLRWPRDADRLPNGHTLVTDSDGNRVLEVDESGRVVWSITVKTPYEAERLGTGDESANGRSALAIGYASARPGARLDRVDAPDGPVARAIAFVTGPLVNGVLYVMPSWVRVWDVPAIVLLAGSLLAWAALELRWSRFRLPRPWR